MRDASFQGHREWLHMSDNTLPRQHWGGGGGHEMWVNLIGWLYVQTSLRAMKRGVCCTKLLWIHVYTCTYHTHTHTDAIVCGVCFQLWYAVCCVLCVVGHKKYSFTEEHTPHVGNATIKHVVCPFSLRLMEFFLIWLQDDVTTGVTGSPEYPPTAFTVLSAVVIFGCN